MRKITLLAFAAITTMTAFGATPTVDMSQSTTPRTATVKKAIAINKSALNQGEVLSANVPESRADEATPSNFPLYNSAGAFYLGMGQDKRGYNYKFGFTSASGFMGYVPNATTTACEWSYTELGEAEDGSEDIPHTSAETNLVVNLEPLMQFEGPTLKATLADGIVEYNDSTAVNFAGGSPYFWGFYKGDKEAPVETQYLVGVTPCPFDGEMWSSTTESEINRTGAEGYNSNGASAEWDTALTDDNNNILYTDVQITGYSYKMPSTFKPYQLSGFYIWVSSTVDGEDAVPLTVTVYGYDKDGYLDKNIVLGRGVASLPAGEYDGLMAFTLQAVNANGRPINSPICTKDDIWISMQGFENENIKTFTPVYNFNLSAPVTDYRNPVYKKAYPTRAVIDLKCKDTATGEYEEIHVGNPWIYGGNPTAYFAREYAMYFFIDYPIVMNAEDGTGTFVADLPVEGSTQLYIASSEDIAQLYSDDTLVGETEEWISYDIVYDEEEKCAVLTVWANSDCPEGEDGRTGTITFTGYACDFDVTVNQPAGGKGTVIEGSINEIAGAAQGGATEYFDLQGRKLSAAPAKGVYIQRNGATATKLVK